MHRSARAGTTPDEWHTSVIGNLSQAGRAHGQAEESVVSSMVAVQVMNSECSKHRDAVHLQLFQKVQNTKELASQLSTRIRSVRCTLEHTEWSLQKLQQASHALQEPMELCKSRIAMRTKRPKREQVCDPFQEALLKQEQELQNSRVRFSDAIADTQKLIRELKDELAKLEADFKDKNHAAQIDGLCKDRKRAVEANNSKLDKVYPGGPIPLREVLPEILSTPRNNESSGRFQERQRQKDTLMMIERVLRLEDQAKQRWQGTSSVLDQCKASTANALKKTQTEMGTKIADTEILRQELSKQKKVTEGRIAEAQRVLGLTEQKLAYIAKPMMANNERTRIRGTRTPREATADEVTEALHSQLSGLEAQRMELMRQVSSLRTIIEELEMARVQLNEDISDKDKALSIDRACAAARNAAHGTYSYGVSKVGDGQRVFSDTASSLKRRT